LELYEDIIDRRAVEYFEAQEAKGNVSFLTAADLDASYTAPKNPKSPPEIVASTTVF